MNVRPDVKYAKPDEDRVIKLFKEGKTFYSIMEDQHCTIEDLFEVLQRAHFYKKI